MAAWRGGVATIAASAPADAFSGLMNAMNPVDRMLDGAIKAMMELMQQDMAYWNTDGFTIDAGIDRVLSVAYGFVQRVMAVATGPIGNSILAICVLLSLYEALTRNAELRTGEKSMETIVLTLVTFAALKVVIDNAGSLMLYFDHLSRFTAVSIRSVVVPAGEVYVTPDVGGVFSDGSIAAVLKVYRDANALLSLFLITLMSWLAVTVAVFAAKVLLLARYMEMLLYIAFSPIPLATLAHEQTRDIGKGYLVNYAAVCFQVAIIMFIMKVYPYMMTAVFSQTMVVRGAIESASMHQATTYVMQPVVYSIVFLMGVLGVGALSRRIFGR